MNIFSGKNILPPQSWLSSYAYGSSESNTVTVFLYYFRQHFASIHHRISTTMISYGIHNKLPNGDEADFCYLADRLDATDCTEEDEYPSKQQAESEIPLDNVCVHVYAVRYSQNFMPALSSATHTAFPLLDRHAIWFEHTEGATQKWLVANLVNRRNPDASVKTLTAQRYDVSNVSHTTTVQGRFYFGAGSTCPPLRFTCCPQIQNLAGKI